MAFWHLLSIRAEVVAAKDKLNTSLGQSVVNLERAFLESNAVEFQKLLWQIKNDGVKYMKFMPGENGSGNWMFKEVAVGELLSNEFGVLGGSAEVVSNGAKLGRLDYVIDILEVNRVVFARNYALFVTVVFFFLGLLAVSNLGAIRTLLAIERSVKEINSLTAAGRGEGLRDAIKKNLSALPADIIGTPFARMTESMSEALGEASRLESELAVSKAVSDMAAQVAHDIRSPLAALGAAAGGLKLPPEQKALIDGAVGRMQGIADDLLKRYRAPAAASDTPKPAPHSLNALVAQVAAEKRLQHGGKPGVKIEYAEPAGEIRALVEPKEFQRLVSNLVNNAVEAFERGGTVKISLATLDGKARLKVQDDGKGMPAELLARMGQRGATQGKAGGTGLGVYHAKASVEGWGGAFRMDSEPGKGTTVTIELPRLEGAEAPKLAVLLDDDALVHMNWRMAARAAGAELKTCKTLAELEAALAGLLKDVPVYIDSELGDGVRGEDIAKDLHAKGYTALSMATGHGAENFAHLPWLKVAGKEPPWPSK